MIRFLAIVLLAALLPACMAVRSRAASSLPPSLENASDEEKARYLEEQGKRSLAEKQAVGWQRYNERLAFRQALANNMRSNFEQRSTAVLSQFSAPPEPAPSAGPHRTSYQTWTMWIGVLVFAAILIYHRYFEKHPEDRYTVVKFGEPKRCVPDEPKVYDLDQAV